MAQLYVNDLLIRNGDVAIDGLLDIATNSYVIDIAM